MGWKLHEVFLKSDPAGVLPRQSRGGTMWDEASALEIFCLQVETAIPGWFLRGRFQCRYNEFKVFPSIKGNVGGCKSSRLPAGFYFSKS